MRDELSRTVDALLARAQELDKRRRVHARKAEAAECEAAYHVHHEQAEHLSQASMRLVAACQDLYAALVELEQMGE